MNADRDNLHRLRLAGFPVDSFTAEQSAVFRQLSEQELAVVLDIKAKLDAVEPDVLAHENMAAGAAMF